jgi:hypothetical protein
MYARGLSVRDIEAAFTDESGRCVLSRTAASELTERLGADYQAFASRELGEFKVLYLFVDGIAEKLHLGQPREAVLAAWGITETGQKVLLGLTPGTKEDTASCRDFLGDLKSRGLVDPILGATDGAPGLIRAFEEVFPRSLRQRCLAHKIRNLQTKVRGLARGEGRGPCRLPGGEPKACENRQGGLRRPLRARVPERDGLLPGRLRGLYRAPAAADRAPARNAYDQPARAAVWRGAPAHQGHPARLRRARGARAHVRGADSRQRHLEADRDLGVRVQTTREPARAPEPCSRRAHRARREERIPLTNFQQG